MEAKNNPPRDPESERPLRYSVLNGAVMDGDRTLFISWKGNDEQAKLLVASLNDAAAEVSGDRDPAPAAAREDDAGDGSTVQCEVRAAESALDPFDVVVSNSWTLTGSMSVARRDHTATLLNDGKVLIVGWTTQTAELYDPATGGFTATGSTVFAHGQGSTATRLLDGTILVIGGAPGAGAEIYDPAAGTFSATGNLNAGHGFHTATLLDDGTVLIVGGNPSPKTSAEIYDPATGTFSPTGSLQVGRGGHAATLLPDGRVLVVGGSTPSVVCLNSAEIYDPASGTFATTGSMQTARCSIWWTHLIVLATGRVLVVGGGGTSTFTRDPDPELFDPATGTFSTTGTMATAHFGGTATLLPDGQVLVAGGLVNNAATTGAELYDPTTGAFTLAASMNEARFQNAATLLLDGRVLVTGGRASTTELSSAELYGR